MILTQLIVILGLTTVILSFVVAYKFYVIGRDPATSQHKWFTRALVWQLIGEGLLGAGTLAFAVAAHLDLLSRISYDIQSAMRFLMFFVTAATTWHLYNKTKMQVK